MGKLILHELEQLPELGMLYVCDIAFDKDYEEDGKVFFRNINKVKKLHVDVAFVAATASAHFDILKTLISFGVRNIFVEKPAVLTVEEYSQIMAISADCRIVIGYILRHADSISVLKELADKAVAEGFHLDTCKVVYEKYLPVTAEERAWTDLGIFDETPHIWDLLFNYLGLKNADSMTIACRDVKYEESKPDRAIEATFIYDLSFAEKSTTVAIHSSFLSKDRKRCFEFCYSRNAEKRVIVVDLDRPENKDVVLVKDGNDNIVFSCDYPSLTKIRNEIHASMEYFNTGRNPNIALFSTENIVLNLYNQVK